MQDRMDARQDGCRTRRMQYSKNAGQMQYSWDAGQYRSGTGQMQYRSDAGKDRAVHVRCRKGQMLLMSDPGGQVRCITGLMQDRMEEGHFRCRTGLMQCRVIN